jgi:hypothetical protein
MLSAILGGLGCLAAAGAISELAYQFARRSKRAHRAAAPPLNPRWDTSVCKHPEIEPVIPSGEEETVAYLCVDPECYAQLELTDPTVIRWSQTRKISDNWAGIRDQIEAGSITSDQIYIRTQPDFTRFASETRAAIDKAVEEAQRSRRKAAHFKSLRSHHSDMNHPWDW